MELQHLNLAISCTAAVLAMLGAVGCVIALPTAKKEKADKTVVFSLFLVISLPAVIIWKIYRKFKYGCKLTD